ncbi:hypothetical protein OXX79_009664 [Metschnikowia pulcherrima]
MDRLNPLAIPLHPVTKIWVCAIGASAVAISMELISFTKLVFLPSRVFVEPWRLVTSFCFFGALSFTLVQYIIIIARTNNSLEENYLFRSENMPRQWVCQLDKDSNLNLKETLERNRTYDFAYFIAEIAFSIVAVVTVLSRWYDISASFFLLGPGLEKILLYILCRNTPSEHLQIMGISITAKYAPILTQFLEFLFSSELQKFSHSVRHDPYQAVTALLTSSLAQQTFLVFSIGHLWWYISHFYLKDVYNETSTKNREEWSRAFVAIKMNHFAGIDLSNLYRYLITPPWYYAITRKLLREQKESRGRLEGLAQSRIDHVEITAVTPENASDEESVGDDNYSELIDLVDGSSGARNSP